MRAARYLILPVASSALSVGKHNHCHSRRSGVQSDIGETGHESSTQVTNGRFLLLHWSRSSHTTAHVTSWEGSASNALMRLWTFFYRC